MKTLVQQTIPRYAIAAATGTAAIGGTVATGTAATGGTVATGTATGAYAGGVDRAGIGFVHVCCDHTTGDSGTRGVSSEARG